MDKDEINKNIDNLSLALFKEQIKVISMMKIVSLIDYSVNCVDRLSELVIMLTSEMQGRLENGITETGWEGLSDSAYACGMTPDEVIKDSCKYFTEQRAKLGISRDKFIQAIMMIRDLEKSHKRFQSDNTEGDINGN